MNIDKICPDNIKAVVFDLDGTLLDTEKLLFRYWREAAAHFGYNMSGEQALTLRSLTHKRVQPLFTEWFGSECDYRQLRACRMKLMQEHIDKYGVEVKKGAAELLEWLGEHGYLRAVATATDTERAGNMLEKVGLSGCFDRIICASMVECGKPEPDIYLYTAKELGLETRECIAVEDSPNGVISASDAGCLTVMVPDLTPPDSTLMPYISAVCNDLAEIKDLLKFNRKEVL